MSRERRGLCLSSILLLQEIYSKSSRFMRRTGSDDTMAMLRDHAFTKQIKTDILRRVEVPSDSGNEEVSIFWAGDHATAEGKKCEVAFDDEPRVEDVDSVRISGDSDEGSADGDEDEDDRETDGQVASMAGHGKIVRCCQNRVSKDLLSRAL